jgi:hypothetical protein
MCDFPCKTHFMDFFGIYTVPAGTRLVLKRRCGRGRRRLAYGRHWVNPLRWRRATTAWAGLLEDGCVPETGTLVDVEGVLCHVLPRGASMIKAVLPLAKQIIEAWERRGGSLDNKASLAQLNRRLARVHLCV